MQLWKSWKLKVDRRLVEWTLKKRICSYPLQVQHRNMFLTHPILGLPTTECWISDSDRSWLISCFNSELRASWFPHEWLISLFTKCIEIGNVMTHHGHQIKSMTWMLGQELMLGQYPKKWCPGCHSQSRIFQDLDEAVISLPNYQAINLRRKHHFVLTWLHAGRGCGLSKRTCSNVRDLDTFGAVCVSVSMYSDVQRVVVEQNCHCGGDWNWQQQQQQQHQSIEPVGQMKFLWLCHSGKGWSIWQKKIQ